jgi:hypothetical protein
MAEPAGQNCGFDANQCTSDVCDGAGLCIHPNRTGPCDDGNQCTGGDECIDGSCVSDPLPDGSACDVGDECTTESCQAGVCAATPVADGTPCDDTIFCTDGSSCQAGLCQEGAPTDCPPCMWCQFDACVVEGYRSGCAEWFNESSALLLRNGGARDAAKWKSTIPDLNQPQAFGDPVGTGFDVCVLDEQHQPEGFPTLLIGAEAPPGAGWKTTASGYLFKSANRSLKLRLEADEAGKSKVQFRVKVPSQTLAYLPPVSNYVTVYVRTPFGAEPDICFHEFFETPTLNTEKKYKAQKPLP